MERFGSQIEAIVETTIAVSKAILVLWIGVVAANLLKNGWACSQGDPYACPKEL